MHRLRLDGGRVLLTLLIGPSQAMLRQQDMVVDSICVSDAATALGKDTQLLYTTKAIARCARRGTYLVADRHTDTFAKSLLQCGFEIEKSPVGQTALHAIYHPRWEPRKASLWPTGAHAIAAENSPSTLKAVVIGAGIAGAACAHQLALRDWQVTVLDTANHPAAGASALPAGIFAPHTSSDDSVLSRITRAGVRAAVQWAQQLLRSGQDWEMTGVLERRQLATPNDETAALVDSALADAAPGASYTTRPGAHERPAAWSEDPALQQAANDWSQPAGIAKRDEQGLADNDTALWHPHAGWLRPAALVQALLAHPNIQFAGGAQVAAMRPATHLAQWQVVDADNQLLAQADLVIICAGPHSQALAPAPLPLQAIRGQVSWGTYPAGSPPPQRYPVNGYGSWVPFYQMPHSAAPAWVMGSSFERDVTALPPSAADCAQAHGDNWRKLQTLLPSTSTHYREAFANANTWAQIRCASADRLPVVGPLPASHSQTGAHMPLWLCTAMGSRGLSWALLCAELLVARLHDEPLPINNALAKALSADRLMALPPYPSINPDQGRSSNCL